MSWAGTRAIGPAGRASSCSRRSTRRRSGPMSSDRARSRRSSASVPASRPRAAPAGPPAPRPALVEQPLNLSYGQVNDYTECPARYRYAHLIRLPTPASHALVVGKALHAVQAYHRSQMDGAPLTREALQAELDRHWESTGFVTRAHEDARRTSARAALDRFWDEQQADPSPVIGVEQEFAFRFGPDRVAAGWTAWTAGRTGPWPWWTTSPATSATGHRRPPIARIAPAGHLRPGWEAEHGRPPDDLALHFLESGEVGTARRRRFASTRRADRRDGRRDRAGNFAANPGPMRCAFRPFRTICPDAAR